MDMSFSIERWGNFWESIFRAIVSLRPTGLDRVSKQYYLSTMDNTMTPETSSAKKLNQPLLHVGSELRAKLEVLAVGQGTRWQDLARKILKAAADV